MSVLAAVRQRFCDHRFHSTGIDCPDDENGFQVQCRRCGLVEWLCCDCISNCEVCA